MGDKELESYLEVINNNDYSLFEKDDSCKDLVDFLKKWDALPEEVQLRILKDLVPKDGIF